MSEAMYKVTYEVTAYVIANDADEATEKAVDNLKATKCNLGIIAELKNVTLHHILEAAE